MDRRILLAVAGLLIVAAIFYLEGGKAHPFGIGIGGGGTDVASSTVHSANYAANAMKYPRAKEFVSPDGFINTGGQPITLADYIGKKVVLIDFWTYSCINCQRTIPYLEGWYKKYEDAGLVIIGVHTPEFDFEKVLANVQAGVTKFGITYPVVLDSNFGTWQAYNNNYWPSEYLIDIDGLVRENNIGEGHYEETEANIQTLLAERAAALGDKTPTPTGTLSVVPTDIEAASPETYFGSARNEYLGNGSAHRPGPQTLTLPTTPKLNTLYLGGTWNFLSEYAETASAQTQVMYHYSAKDVYLVASSKNSVTIKVLVDGKPISADRGADVSAAGEVKVGEARLYKLVESQNQQEHTIQLIITGAGLDAFTFTFG